MNNARILIANRLRQARGDMTQTFVARSLGISQAVLSKIESGLREPTAAELQSFAKLYKKPVAYFFESGERPVEEKLRTFFKKNTSRFDIKLAFLYGSFARGIPNEASDIDIAVLFSNEDQDDDKTFEIIADISFKLGQRMKREVNVIAIRPNMWKPMLYYNVIVLGSLLFSKSRNDYLSLRWEAIQQMEDFVAMGFHWQIIAARANLRRLKHG